MRILVTGSSGFIGFHLIKFLIKKNDIFGIDNNNKYYSNSLKNYRYKILKKNKKYKFKKINLIHKKKLNNVFIKFKPEIVIHLAGQPGVLYSLKNPKSYYINNVLATKSICEICLNHNVKKFILGSSSSVYGEQIKYPITEKSKTNPKNPYAKTKLKSEELVKNFFKGKIDYVIFRFFTVYGPIGRPDMFIHKFLNSIKSNRLIKLYNGGLNFRDFTYVDDVVKILANSIFKNLKFDLYNICRSKPILTNQLVKHISTYFKSKEIKIKKISFVKGEMLKTHGSNVKLKKEFGNLKFTDIETGLNNTIKHFKKYNN